MEQNRDTNVSARREPGYLRLLSVLLGITAFFQAYDSALTAVAIPKLARSFNVAISSLNRPILLIGLSGVLGILVASISDRVGRRRIIIASTLLFAIFTGASASASSSGMFIALQLVARTFLFSAYVLAIVVVAEEFPADRRGQAIGLLAAMSSLGIAAALLYPLAADTALGWRYLYLIGLSPILFVALLAGGLRETRRWTSAVNSGGHRGLQALFSGNQRAQLLQVGGLFFFTNFAVLGSTTWWGYFARRTGRLTESAVVAHLIAAYIAAAIGCLVAGKMQDVRGRRRTGTIFLFAGLIFGVVMFRVSGSVPLFLALAAALFFGLGASSVTNAYAAELFPTEIRATVTAVTRSVFGTLGAILGPLAVGVLGGGVARASSANVATNSLIALVMFIPAILILRSLPETAGRELEDIAAAAEIPEVVSAPYAFAAKVTHPLAPAAETFEPQRVEPQRVEPQRVEPQRVEPQRVEPRSDWAREPDKPQTPPPEA